MRKYSWGFKPFLWGTKLVGPGFGPMNLDLGRSCQEWACQLHSWYFWSIVSFSRLTADSYMPKRPKMSSLVLSASELLPELPPSESRSMWSTMWLWRLRASGESGRQSLSESGSEPDEPLVVGYNQ
jgi:hypothetical protein